MSDHYHHGLPDSFRFKGEFLFKGEPLNLYLDTSSQDRVLGLYYSWSGDDETASAFSNYARLLEGLNFGELPDQEHEGLHAPTLFYRLLLDQVKRGSPLYPYAKGRDPLKLVCRCFGVYEEDIHELFGYGTEVETIKDLGDHLQAGVGCGSCHYDLKQILEPLVSAPVVVPDEEKPVLPLWQKLDPDSLAKLAFQELKNLNKEEGFNVSLLGTKPGGILVKFAESVDNTEENQKLIEQKIEAALGRGLDISLQ
jgi:bacterioferritin-associated ferredoxin